MNKASLTICCVLLAGSVGLGDWDPGDTYKMHWPQLPDPDPSTSLDVATTTTRILADDWRCSESGPVTDVHIWGSWRDDVLPEEFGMEPDAGLIDFRLTIRADVPAADSPTGHSTPGALLWQGWFSRSNPVGVNSFTVRECGQWDQGWYDSSSGIYDPSNHRGVWQYNFDIDPANVFSQEENTIYWLDVMAFPGSHPSVFPQFGWNISRDHWMDDAVWADDLQWEGWQELYHPGTDESLDMAFVIAPEPGMIGLLALGGLGLIRRKRARHDGLRFMV